MANVHGKDTTFSIDDTGGSPTDVSAYVDTSSLSRAIELADTTAYGDEDRTFIAGLASATIPIGGPWDATFDGYVGTTTQQKVARTFSYVFGGVTYSGEAFIENYTVDNPVGDKVAWSANLQVTGAVGRA